MKQLIFAVLALASGALLAINWAPLLDAATYRPLVLQARDLLPPDWRMVVRSAPQNPVAALEAAQSEAQQVAMNAVSARFRMGPNGAFLALPHGFETEDLDLSTGCFRFARRRVDLFVWQYDSAIGCIR